MNNLIYLIKNMSNILVGPPHQRGLRDIATYKVKPGVVPKDSSLGPHSPHLHILANKLYNKLSSQGVRVQSPHHIVWQSFAIKLIKEIQIMKGSLKVDNPITSKIDGYKIWAIFFFVRIFQGLKIRILGCIFSKINFVHMPHEG